MTTLSGDSPLPRVIGRWTLTALVVNAIIGSGIFGLPDEIARHLGAAAPVCAAVVVLRRRRPDADRFTLPGGWVLPALGLAFCVLIAAQMEAAHAWIGLGVEAVAAVNWAWAARAGAGRSSLPRA